jgi:2-oxoglutarate dehydrogenase E1 component
MSKVFEAESFLYNANARFIEELYEKYTMNPESVEQKWRDFFKNYQADQNLAAKLLQGASWSCNTTQVISNDIVNVKEPQQSAEASNAANLSLVTQAMTKAFRERGHMIAKLDPLCVEVPSSHVEQHLTHQDFGINTDVAHDDILRMYNTLNAIYCDKIGYEFEHLQSIEEKAWLYENVEQLHLQKIALDKPTKTAILENLVEAEAFESFIHSRFPGAKRFSLEGGESAVVFMLEILKQASQNGCVESVLGMAHRGRLNMMTKIYGKSHASLFAEFRGTLKQNPDCLISGDVKYHAGISTDAMLEGRKLHLTMLPNPSHLEAINPVVQGKVRALQDIMGDQSRQKVQGVLIHGDAAFAGQGIVAEALTFAGIAGYKSGGTMHLVINNQVGFTASSFKTKAGKYATDIAKSINAPIIHINSEDVEGVLLIARIAENYRHKFGKDIVVDLICYRKYGHNEGDEPMFTQPLMYSIIKGRANPHQLYFKQLTQQGIIEEAEYKKIISNFVKKLDAAYNKSEEGGYYETHQASGHWAGMVLSSSPHDASLHTGVKLEILQKIGTALHSYPQNFNLNSKILRLIQDKQDMISGKIKIDWAMAEGLAFGSLMCEGIKVRLSGEDAGRGTFSHRHSVLTDQKTGEIYIPLDHIPEAQGSFEVIDSNLSEYGVMGFEYGYSLATPNNLVIWEGQFGDFANGAQIIIDQFIAASEQKWLRMSGLVLLLPHGYEGQGPEHSSARLERFLQLCAENNMQVVNCTTPANYFHVLRRQIHRSYRKPLVVMTPKSMLRVLQSDLNEFDLNTCFRPVIDDNEVLDKQNIRRVILCSGKIYFDLRKATAEAKQSGVAIIRLEQLYPFPAEHLESVFKEYKNAEFVWCQEEPQNMGAWHFIYHLYRDLLKKLGFTDKFPQYIGRTASASPATGYAKVHEIQQKQIADQAINI